MYQETGAPPRHPVRAQGEPKTKAVLMLIVLMLWLIGVEWHREALIDCE